MTAQIPRLKRAVFMFGTLTDVLTDAGNVDVPPMAWPEMEELNIKAAEIVDTSVETGSNGVIDVEYHDDRRAFWEAVPNFDWGWSGSMLDIAKLADWAYFSYTEADMVTEGEGEQDMGPRPVSFEIMVAAQLMEETSFKVQLERAFAAVKIMRLKLLVIDEVEFAH
ncbi:hypothetical protein GGF32_004589 [Allomyces javanicus]|nr:hypothetical protein GGF32_004589 [Allomyces javanicus]